MSQGGNLSSEDAERYGTPEDPRIRDLLMKWFLGLSGVDKFNVFLAIFGGIHFIVGMVFLWVYLFGPMNANDPMIGRFVLMFGVTFACGCLAFFAKMVLDDY